MKCGYCGETVVRALRMEGRSVVHICLGCVTKVVNGTYIAEVLNTPTREESP